MVYTIWMSVNFGSLLIHCGVSGGYECVWRAYIHHRGGLVGPTCWSIPNLGMAWPSLKICVVKDTYFPFHLFYLFFNISLLYLTGSFILHMILFHIGYTSIQEKVLNMLKWLYMKLYGFFFSQSIVRLSNSFHFLMVGVDLLDHQVFVWLHNQIVVFSLFPMNTPLEVFTMDFLSPRISNSDFWHFPLICILLFLVRKHRIRLFELFYTVEI